MAKARDMPGKLKQPPSDGWLEQTRALLRKAASNKTAARGAIAQAVQRSMGRGDRVELVNQHGFSDTGYVVRLEDDGRTGVAEGDSTLVAVLDSGERVALREVSRVERAL